MKITAIKQQSKDKGRYSVFVDGKFSFGVGEFTLIHATIRVGQDVSKEQILQYKEQSTTEKYYAAVLRLLSRRSRSKWEITTYLRRKGVTNEKIQLILNMLSERGYVDDSKFAYVWVENRRLLKPTSRRKLVAELKAKRISDEIISEVLSSDTTNDKDVLQEEITRKRRQTRYQDDKKLIAYLSRQGYSYGDIKDALKPQP